MPFSARMSVRVNSTRVSLVHGMLTISPLTAVDVPETPAGKLSGARSGWSAMSESSGSSAPASAKVASLERPICRMSGPLPEATAVVSFSSIASHGIATTSTSMPLSATRVSKLVPESPMTQTVNGPDASSVGAEQADIPSVRPATAAMARAVFAVLFIEVPFLVICKGGAGLPDLHLFGVRLSRGSRRPDGLR